MQDEEKLVFRPTLTRLKVRPGITCISLDRVALVMGQSGFVEGHSGHGLFARETRFLSRYLYKLDSKPAQLVSMSNVTQDHWVGYYLADGASGASPLKDAAKQAIELQLTRRVTRNGLREEARLSNFTQKRRRVRLTIELHADFADLAEMPDARKQIGRKKCTWTCGKAGSQVTFLYSKRHRYSHQGETGETSLRCSLEIEFSAIKPGPKWKNGSVQFNVTLAPRETWSCKVNMRTRFEALRDTGGHTIQAAEAAHTASKAHDYTVFDSPESQTMTSIVVRALNQGRRDLEALRLFDLDQPDGGWVPAAGVPMYLALFGRDTLTAAWEAAPVTIDVMRGTLPALARWQGRTQDNWRDEEPGKMLHEMHTGPLSILNYIPQALDYGSVTTSAFYPFVVAQLWHWTGDKALVAPFLGPATRALQWLDSECAKGKGGFCWYQTRSTQGVKNQSWKDSGDAIVYEDGSQVSDPIATCEQQGIIYAAKLNFAEVLWWFGRRDEAKRQYREAVDLKRQFNRRFWMKKEGFVALALDPKGRQVRSITSNPLHCVATGIVDDAYVPQVLARLFAQDMFSGWGVRTLSSNHPAYNPYAYHRGTVWPVEHGPFAVGAYRYGQHEYVERICRGQFELASLFDHAQLPECVAGHPKDLDHPFPALYPAANAPQAWSATTPFILSQAMLGLQPFAPLKMLFVDPFLPPWLPDITISNMKVGSAVVSLRFYRKPNGSSGYEVLESRGSLHIVRQPSPWSFTATLAERAGDALISIFH